MSSNVVDLFLILPTNEPIDNDTPVDETDDLLLTDDKVKIPDNEPPEIHTLAFENISKFVSAHKELLSMECDKEEKRFSRKCIKCDKVVTMTPKRGLEPTKTHLKSSLNIPANARRIRTRIWVGEGG